MDCILGGNVLGLFFCEIEGSLIKIRGLSVIGIINPIYPFGHESVDDLPRKWSWSVARLPWSISGAHHGAETIKVPAKMGTYKKDHNWLVVWNMNFKTFIDFPFSWEFHHPN